MRLRKIQRCLKVAILVAGPWFTTGCGLLQALGSVLGTGAGSLAGVSQAGATASTGAKVPPPAVPLPPVRPPRLTGSALLGQDQQRAAGLGVTGFGFLERVPVRDRT